VSIFLVIVVFFNIKQDMAGTILFLASRAGAYVNGAVWLVDGGRIGTVPSNY
jgi:NAD(P)-dependent dehydrogenase (short-subunit alcohol dehydrogenase family)